MVKVAFFSVVLNHHQALLADELYEQTNHQFVFVELVPPSDENTKGGGNSFSNRPYLLQSWKDESHKQQAVEVALTAEVAMFGGGLDYLKIRMNKSLLSFDVGERWLKRGLINLLSPRLLKNMWYYHINHWGAKPLYKLCSSAYACADQYRLRSFKNKCYKWGYFTKVDDFEVEALKQGASHPGITQLMWCARFLRWKHPEIPIMLARKLKDDGRNVVIDMYGEGEEQESSKLLAKKLGVTDIVNFSGNIPNQQVLEEMRRHEIFLFTSDKNEGWGAVLNEAMSNGCTVVASNKIGSVPFLVNDGVNGMVFNSGDIESLYEKVVYLLDNPLERNNMAQRAYQDMSTIWSPKQAACNLLQLIDDLQHGRETSIKEGPCSKALPL